MKRLILGINGQGQVKHEHDDMTAAEWATLALVVHDLALEVLKNGSARDVSESGTNGGDSLR
jgi:hypothetical protein